jgi:hypothetical protein
MNTQYCYPNASTQELLRIPRLQLSVIVCCQEHRCTMPHASIWMTFLLALAICLDAWPSPCACQKEPQVQDQSRQEQGKRSGYQ